MELLGNEIHETDLDYKISNSNKPIICGICGENHSVNDCTTLKVTNHIPDKVIPSKARLTLPDSLEIKKLADCTYSIYVRCLIERGTQFGPFQAKKLFTLHPSIDFPLKIFTNSAEDLTEYFLDTSDENECSWMIFVRPANDFEEQNTICYQEGENLYYVTIRDIPPGESLKVWYSPYYATKMKKEVLNTNNCQENIIQMGPVDVETIIKNKKNITARDSWSCKFCGKVEKEVSKFALHLLDHYKAQMSRTCTICKESFLNRARLKKHLQLVHGNNTKKSVEIVSETQILVSKVKDANSKEVMSVGGPLLLNDIIPDSLDNSSLFLPQTDISQFDLSSITNQNILLENENLNLNMDNILTENVKGLDHFNFDITEPETDQLVCDVCLKSFVKLKSLIQHIEQHTGKFVCYSCNRVFARKENLVYHSCNTYFKEKCPLCERLFFQKKRLTHHIKAVHNKQFTCDKCNNYYESQKTLENHNCLKIPLDKKVKFPCSICPKIFFKKWNLEQHIARHKHIKKDTQYICAFCNTLFKCKSSYFKHIQLHEGQLFLCDICNKQFRRKDYLNLHKKRVHLSEVQTCEICKKKLKSKKLLKIHMETHQKDKPYKCRVCPAAFKQHSNLSRHRSKHNMFEKKLELLFQDNVEVYHCPKCNKNMKLKTSLQRHMRVFHPDDEFSNEIMKPKMGKLTAKKLNRTKDGTPDYESEDNESVMDLKQTIENMNFNTDEVNCSENNDINIEIDKILNNAGNIDDFLTESNVNDPIVESLINIAAKENQLCSVSNQYVSKEVCLSMPDLTENNEDVTLENNKIEVEFYV